MTIHGLPLRGYKPYQSLCTLPSGLDRLVFGEIHVASPRNAVLHLFSTEYELKSWIVSPLSKAYRRGTICCLAFS